MSKGRIRVTIPEARNIPTIGKGPINRPISITIAQYDMLVRFGFKVNKADYPMPAKIEKLEDNSKTQEEVANVVETEVVAESDTQSEQTVEESVQETSEEVVIEEGSEEEISEEDYNYTEEELTDATKADLKEVLDKRGVSYKHNETLPKLKELVIKSNK